MRALSAGVFFELPARGPERVAHRDANVVMRVVLARFVADRDFLARHDDQHLDAKALVSRLMAMRLIDGHFHALDVMIDALEARRPTSYERVDRGARVHVSEGY